MITSEIIIPFADRSFPLAEVRYIDSRDWAWATRFDNYCVRMPSVFDEWAAGSILGKWFFQFVVVDKLGSYTKYQLFIIYESEADAVMHRLAYGIEELEVGIFLKDLENTND